MLQKIIKTHTTLLGVVDIIKPTFLRNAVATNHQRRVIASIENVNKDQNSDRLNFLFVHFL